MSEAQIKVTVNSPKGQKTYSLGLNDTCGTIYQVSPPQGFKLRITVNGVVMIFPVSDVVSITWEPVSIA